jgi:hypothetical protein
MHATTPSSEAILSWKGERSMSPIMGAQDRRAKGRKGPRARFLAVATRRDGLAGEAVVTPGGTGTLCLP